MVFLVKDIEELAFLEISVVDNLQQPGDEFDHVDLVEYSLFFGVGIICIGAYLLPDSAILL